MSQSYNRSINVHVKGIEELNLYTESGLVKMAIGVKLEGLSPSLTDEQRKYRYTRFNRGEPDLFSWKESFHYDVFNIQDSDKYGLFVKFRVVEEGPQAIITVPYDSRSASPVYEILPEQQKRSIIAYGRVKLELGVEGLFETPVELFELMSDERCGELAISLSYRSQLASLIPEDRSHEIHQPTAIRPSLLLQSSPIEGSMEAVGAADSVVVLNEAEGGLEEKATLAESVSPKSEECLSASASFTSRSRSPLAEANDALDEHLMTLEIKSILSPSSSRSSSPSEGSAGSSEQSSGKLCENFADVVGLLSLEIVTAHSLPRERRLLRAPNYEVNPFVTISFGKKSFKTKVKWNTSNPIWKEKLAFSVRSTELSYQVMFSIYDYENFGYNSCLASASIRASHFLQNPEQLLKLAIPLNPAKQVAKNDACLLVKGCFYPYERIRRNFWTKLLRAFDLNSNGFLCKLEFETMLESLGSTLSESTISQIFAAVERSDNQEISIEEAVGVLEDLTVTSAKGAMAEPGLTDETDEKLVILSSCPFCMKRWSRKTEEIDVITHLGICSASESSHIDRFVMGGFLTEEYASRKWFSRLLSFMSFGNYRIGRNNGNILVQDRKTGKLLEEKMPTYIRLGIRILHQNVVTYRAAVDFGYVRHIFQSLTMQQGKKFDHPSSVHNISGFIKFHGIPVHEIADPLSSFKNFNEFFYRKIRLKEFRPLAGLEDATVAVSPADCRLNVFESVDEAKRLWIKGINFSMETLLKDSGLAEYFQDAALMIARLAPQDYHRFHSPVDGRILMNYHIPGSYYTVNPMAVRQKVDVYTENARTVTLIDSPQFGKVAFVSIGAMMVGSIKITAEVGMELKRMDEVGYFAFGGSTIVVLFHRDSGLVFDTDLLENSREQLETLIKVGDSIGRIRSQS